MGVTTVFVTHDQDEALALSDPIVVMTDGQIEQIGPPETVYREPASTFVADFMGSSNLLTGEVTHDAALTTPHRSAVQIGPDRLTLIARTDHELTAGEPVTVSIRPEAMRLHHPHDVNTSENTFAATIIGRTFLGSRYQYRVLVAGHEVLVATDKQWDHGEAALRIPAEDCRVFPTGPPASQPVTQRQSVG